MKRFLLVLTITAVMVLMLASQALAQGSPQDRGAFPLPTFVCFGPPGPPGTEFGFGTGIETPGTAAPCLPTEVGPPDGDIIIE